MKDDNQLPFLAGLQLQTYNDLEPSGQVVKGVAVVNLTDSSDGAIAGLMPDDVIISANEQPVTNVQQLVEIAKSHPKELLLKVSRAAMAAARGNAMQRCQSSGGSGTQCVAKNATSSSVGSAASVPIACANRTAASHDTRNTR